MAAQPQVGSPTETILNEIDGFEQQVAAGAPRDAWQRVTTDVTRLDGPTAGRQSRNLAGSGARDYAQGQVERWLYFDENGNPERELRIVRNPAGQIVTVGTQDQTEADSNAGSQLDAFAAGLETSLRVQMATGLQAGGVIERRAIQTHDQSRLQYTLTVRTELMRDPQTGREQRGSVTEFEVDPQTGNLLQVVYGIIDPSDQLVRQTQAAIAIDVYGELPAEIQALGEAARQDGSQATNAPVVVSDPAGAWVAVGRQDRLILYDTTTWTVSREVPVGAFGGVIRSVAVTQTGQTLALGLRGPDGGAFGVALIDTTTWSVGSTFRLDTATDLLALAWSPDGQGLFAPAEFGGLTRWNVRDGLATGYTPPVEEQGPVSGLALSRDGGRAAGLGQIGINLWDVTGPDAPKLLIGDPAWGAPIAAAWTPSGAGLWALYASAWLVPWNIDPIGPGAPLDLGWGASSLALSPNGAWLAADGGRLRVFEADNLAVRWETDTLPVDLVAVMWTPDNLSLLTLDVLGTVELWNAETGQRLTRLPRP